jgi:plasmid maintenance system killer protein
MSKRKKLIAAYFQSFEEIDTEKRDAFWAYQRVSEYLENPEEAWSISLDLISAAPSKEALAFVGADIFEELLNSNGALFLDRLENLADSDKRVLYALANVWPRGAVHETHQNIMRKHSLLTEADADQLAAEIFCD